MRTNKKQADVSPRRLLTAAGLASAGTGMCSAPAWLSFRRIADIPFEACVAALESWRLQGPDGELHVGQSRLRGLIEHDLGSGTCRVEVRLARGRCARCCACAARRLLVLLAATQRARAHPVRARPVTASYFRAGHLLLDSLSRSLQLERQIQALDLPAGQPSDPARAPRGSRDLPQPAEQRR